MSAIVKYIELELEREEIVSRVVKAGEVTEQDQLSFTKLIHSLSENVTNLFDGLARRSCPMFDMIALNYNHDTRFALCQGFAEIQASKHHGVKIEDLETKVSYEVCVEQSKAGSAALIELARNNSFMDMMDDHRPEIARKMRGYLEAKGDCAAVLESGEEYYDRAGREQSARLSEYLSNTLRRAGYPSATI